MNTIITADACINHNGSYNTLIELLQMVKKVQDFTGEKVLFKLQKRDYRVYSNRPYYSWLLEREVPYKIHKEALEFSIEQYKEFSSEAKSLGVEWYISVFDYGSLGIMANNFEFKYWKIASPVTADLPELAVEIAKQPGIKFISTGMCNVEELDTTVNNVLKVSHEDNLYLLHCVSMYPVPSEKVNLKSIDWLRKRYGLKVGYSSHDTGVAISVAAVAKGVTAIEKHFTLDRGLPGPDHGLSLEMRGLETLVRHIREIEKATGEECKVFYKAEERVRDKVRISQPKLLNHSF